MSRSGFEDPEYKSRMVEVFNQLVSTCACSRMLYYELYASSIEPMLGQNGFASVIDQSSVRCNTKCRSTAFVKSYQNVNLLPNFRQYPSLRPSTQDSQSWT